MSRLARSCSESTRRRHEWHLTTRRGGRRRHSASSQTRPFARRVQFVHARVQLVTPALARASKAHILLFVINYEGGSNHDPRDETATKRVVAGALSAHAARHLVHRGLLADLRAAHDREPRLRSGTAGSPARWDAHDVDHHRARRSGGMDDPHATHRIARGARAIGADVARYDTCSCSRCSASSSRSA